MSARRQAEAAVTFLRAISPDRPNDWRDSALCAQVDPALWFPKKGDPAGPAKQVCGRCPAQAECLAEALANDERWGIWGGVTERARRNLQPRPGPRRPNDVTPEEAAQIRKLIDSGLPTSVIATRTGRSHSTVDKVRWGWFENDRRGVA